jgi:transposase
MSLQPISAQSVPELTAEIARKAFPKGNPYLSLRDQMGTIFEDEDFLDLYAHEGQPGLSPWRLAWVTIMQFRETLSDRQAAEAVRARIDWKYFLGLELTDAGFDFSVLSEFRDRLLAGSAEERLLDQLLERSKAHGLLKSRGQQRTDSTHVLAAIRVLNRLELVGETLRAALNELATVAPEWLQNLAPLEWYERYSKRVEDSRLPREQSKRDAYAQTVGEDGFALLDALEDENTPEDLRELPTINALRGIWQRHYERRDPEATSEPSATEPAVRFKDKRELSKAAEGLESPYDVDARYRKKRETQWSGYMVHVSETCNPSEPYLLTHVYTTSASVHEAKCTTVIEEALVEKELAPDDHFVDAAYVSADLLAKSKQDYDIELRGPTRPDVSWQVHVEGAYRPDDFHIDWDQQWARCPQGKQSISWTDRVDSQDRPFIQVQFSQSDCTPCENRALCTRIKSYQSRVLKLHPQPQYEAFKAAQAWFESEEGKRQYKRRAGIEGTISQGVRAFGMRRSRYRGLDKTHLQNVAIAAAMNIDRLVAWFDGSPRAPTRTSRFAALMPHQATDQDSE